MRHVIYRLFLPAICRACSGWPRTAGADPHRDLSRVRVRPAVIQALGNALAGAKLSDRAFAAQAIENDPYLLFGAVLLARDVSDVANKSFRRRLGTSGLWLHLPLLECHDEPEILHSSIRQFRLTGPDGGQR
jgi:hypothetical protein